MSLNTIAASRGNRASGCRVTSLAKVGSRTISRKLYFSFSALYSGKYRPACRIIQSGGLSRGLQASASSIRWRPVMIPQPNLAVLETFRKGGLPRCRFPDAIRISISLRVEETSELIPLALQTGVRRECLGRKRG